MFIKSYDFIVKLMFMKRLDRILVLAALGLVVYTLLLSLLGPVVSSLLASRTYSNTGSVKAVGVGVYWDYDCTNAVGAFNWGMIEPGSSKNISCYIRNEGNHLVSLSMYASNWSPAEAIQFMTLAWDAEGKTLDIGSVVKATFTLEVSDSTEGIINFSFDVTIVGTG